MTNAQTVLLIRTTTKHLFAAGGYEGVSMRTLSAASGIGLSSIYHFFADKDVLLKDVFDRINTELGARRRAIKPAVTVEQQLSKIIQFQFDNIEDVVFVLKYYLHFRQDFAGLPNKILPPKAYLHIEEILHRGIASGDFVLPNDQIVPQAKIITHAINDFLLEYYPETPRGAARKALVADLTTFIARSLKYKEVPMK
ncbi:MAG TPA: TetR/AcrR family transcriptional regulator [Candidatus Saccharimonadales bacterium]|nr:TetR/AcrR family transcriptional regulator [Candidatus Saccharimonadales bacterium]